MDDVEKITPTRYVAGFLFSVNLGQVALVKKERPAWQAGKLNGVGGHIEPGESAIQAMRREFWEEAGLMVHQWKCFATLINERVGFEVLWFWSRVLDANGAIVSRTDEQVSWYTTDRLFDYEGPPHVPNMAWLLRMATNDALKLDGCTMFTIYETTPMAGIWDASRG